MPVRCDELAPAAVRKKMGSLPDLGCALGDAMLVAIGGLGLKVVEQIAAAWGAERRDDGYRVWADLDLSS
jgi:hypothetical protein